MKRGHGNLLVGLLLAACASLSAQQVALSARVEVTKNGHRQKNASDVVLWLTPLGTSQAGASELSPKGSEIVKLVQKNKTFDPHILVVPVGATVEFPNRDPFFHNVFSLFDGKRFDLGLYESGTTRYVHFDKPGVSYVFCNIHAQMSAVVVALATPYYGLSDGRGEIHLADVPPGRYELQIFHPSASPEELRVLSREVTITLDDSFLGNFSLTESNAIQAHQNKYGKTYDRADPDNPAYVRP
jgi:plastocyanin